MAIDGYWHAAEEHRQACAAAGLAITAWEEPGLAEWLEDPVVLVVRASNLRRTSVEPPSNRRRTIG